MKKLLIVLVGCILLNGLIAVTPSHAAVFLATRTGQCFEVVRKSLVAQVNPYYVVFRCKNCKCTGKTQEAIGFETMSDAMEYLEDKYGPLKPQPTE
jgi:hypothetical protein